MKNSLKALQGTPKKRKRRRKRKYKTGIHRSLKASKPIKYRSGWEKSVCIYLDCDPNVISYEYEAIAIPYISNKQTGKVRRYYPDFLVHYSDGKKIMVEVKRTDKLLDPKVMKKTEAGKLWCQQHGVVFELWTNLLIEKIKKNNEARLMTSGSTLAQRLLVSSS